jgi:hypothetical protein
MIQDLESLSVIVDTRDRVSHILGLECMLSPFVIDAARFLSTISEE